MIDSVVHSLWNKCPLQYPDLVEQLGPLHSTPLHSWWCFSWGRPCPPSTPVSFGDTQVLRSAHLLPLVVNRAQVISHRTSESMQIKEHDWAFALHVSQHFRMVKFIRRQTWPDHMVGRWCLTPADHINQQLLNSNATKGSNLPFRAILGQFWEWKPSFFFFLPFCLSFSVQDL